MTDDVYTFPDLDGHVTFFRFERIYRRWAFTQRRARWLVRQIPDRDMQTIVYEKAPIGWWVTIEQHYAEKR